MPAMSAVLAHQRAGAWRRLVTNDRDCSWWLGILPTSLASENYSLSAIAWRCLRDHTFNRFGKIMACDTDGRIIWY